MITMIESPHHARVGGREISIYWNSEQVDDPTPDKKCAGGNPGFQAHRVVLEAVHESGLVVDPTDPFWKKVQRLVEHNMILCSDPLCVCKDQ